MSVSHFFRESFLDYFHFDSKLFGTLIPLIIKPGFLTTEFMEGRRKRYAEPFRTFLVISIIYFLLLPLSGDNKPSPKEKEIILRNKEIVAGTRNPNDLHYTIGGINLTAQGRDSILKEIDSTSLRAYVDKHFPKESAASKLILRQAIKIMLSTGQSFATVLEHTASKMIFLLIPVFALLLKLIYIRKNRLYFEHLVFSLHTHAFIFLVFLVFMLIGFLFHISSVYAVLICLVYIFMAMKRYYREGAGKTILKFLLTSFLYMIIGLPVFFILLIMVALFTY